MERENHEAILEQLLDPSLEQSKRTELLQELRVDYGQTLGTLEELTESKTKLESDNQDLIISNSKLFRQIGIVESGKEEEEEKKELSETITLEELEGNK